MSAANGLAARPLLRLGDLTPETRPVEVERAGAGVILAAFVDGPRCPGYVKSKVSAARRAFSQAAYVDSTDEQGQPTRVMADDDDAHWHAYLCDVLMAVIDGLLYPEAETLAGNQAQALDVLRALGWVQSSTGDAAPEAEGEAPTSTTAGSSPASASSTRSRRTRS